MTTRPVHSKLGASGAERWMNCPGSVALLSNLSLPESDEKDYTREGQAMHQAAEHCLRLGLDTWEIVGGIFHDTQIDEPMADAIQVYLDHVRPLMGASLEHWIEYGVSSPVHPLFYGTMDFGARFPKRLHVIDLKGGKGIIVEPEDNFQLKYYAFGLIDQHPEWPDDMEVVLGIVQPRGFHQDGPIREWTTTVGEIREWVHDTLVPAMFEAEVNDTLDAGPWCRFCPAKLVCPLLTSLFGTAAKANPKDVVNLNDDSLGRSYQYVQAVKFYLTAMEEEAFRRLNRGAVLPGTKLVNKKANRVWKPDAAALAKVEFGAEAFTQPEMKGPAKIEALGPTGATFVRKHAFTPDTGLTVALESDNRVGVRVTTTQEDFGEAVKALDGAD